MDDDRAQSRRFLLATSLAFVVVFVTRALAFPHSWWLRVEPLLGLGVAHFDPNAGHPPSPGFPLYLSLARMLMVKAETPFVALVVAAFLSSVAATILLAGALRAIGRDAVGGSLASLMLFMTPSMLVFSSTPAPEASALMFYAIAMLAAARLLDDELPAIRWAVLLGAGVAGTVGCQPEWLLPAVVILAAPALPARSRRHTLVAAFVFVASIAMVFAPLSGRLGGSVELLRWIGFGASNREGLVTLERAAIMNALGPLWLSMPVLLTALAGALAAIRAHERYPLLLVAPAAANLAFVSWSGSVREPVLALLPTIVAICLLAVRGLTELGARTSYHWLRIPVVSVYCLLAWLWVSPLLRARLDAAPPPSKAAIWIDDKIAPGAVVLVAGELFPHATALITKGRVVSLESAGPERALAWYALVPGESSEAGAVVFSWPDSEPLRRLAGSRYRVVSVVPLHAPVAAR